MVFGKYKRAICDNLCKLLQRQTYTLLSSKHGMFLCVAVLFLSFLSIVQFGEVVLEWSVAKYQRSLFLYNDNILHKSYQSRLCLPMPIDIVYTWVNGSDPQLLKQLDHLKQTMEDKLNITNDKTETEASVRPTRDDEVKSKCPYDNCVALNSLVFRLHSQIELQDLPKVDTVFQNAIKISNVTMKGDSNTRRSVLTIITFSSEPQLKLAINRAYTIKGEEVIAQRAYLTTQSVELGVRMRAMALVSIKRTQGNGDSFKQYMQTRFGDKLKKFDFFTKEGVAALTFINDEAYQQVIELKKGRVAFQQLPLEFLPAMMVWEPFPNLDNYDSNNHFSANRFADNNEMRYSLRSVEKHAPWVRKIFIVTNGQIPSWLNLKNPRIKIVTHREIFNNHSHLPTFSSPAIESHLHKIPGLSKKFIYLNDDVFFGRNVWPDDFYTHAKGQKVFLSWPVPNCNEGCPSTWINDKYCDKACNVSDCDWDGGDCRGANTPPSNWQNTLSHLKSNKVKEFCNSGCADSWIGDRYCDSACNNPTCGLDAGDCGVQAFHTLYHRNLEKDTKVVNLPQGLKAMYFNLTSIFGQGQISEGEQNGSPVLRSITIAQKFKVMTLTFHPNQTSTICLRLAGHTSANKTDKIEIKFNITIDTTEVSHKETALLDNIKQSEDEKKGTKKPVAVKTTLFPIRIYNNKTKQWNNKSTWKKVDKKEYCVPKMPDDITIPDEVSQMIRQVENELKVGDVTKKGYERKISEILANKLGLKCGFQPPTTLYSEMKLKMKSLSTKSVKNKRNTRKQKETKTRFSTRHLTSLQVDDIASEWGFLPWERQRSFRKIQEEQEKALIEEKYKISTFFHRSLLDAFSGSLLHVNRVYNRAFGYKSRKVPSHMPHMIDVDIMNELQETFPKEFEETSSHKLRSPNDMQFALSYFYYVIDQTKDFNVSVIFEETDRDQSGTLSDRELRILMAKISFPLDTKTVQNFIKTLKNCTDDQSLPMRPASDQHYGYDLPLITENVLQKCQAIVKQLNNSKKRENKYKHEIVGEDDIIFKMIKNNITHVLLQLDDIRRKQKKFICLNDNIDHDKANASNIKALLVDFYESLFPAPSQFELPDHLRNQHLYVDGLKSWQQRHYSFYFISEIALALLLLVFLYIFKCYIYTLITVFIRFCLQCLRPAKLSTSSSTKLLTV